MHRALMLIYDPIILWIYKCYAVLLAYRRLGVVCWSVIRIAAAIAWPVMCSLNNPPTFSLLHAGCLG